MRLPTTPAASARIRRSVVKSAGRVLQIMAFFDGIQRAANAQEICATLRYPQSSVSLLLHSMLEMGFPRHEPKGPGRPSGWR